MGEGIEYEDHSELSLKKNTSCIITTCLSFLQFSLLKGEEGREV